MYLFFIDFSWVSDVVQLLSKMFRKATAFIALIAFATTVKCDISIYNRDQQQLDLGFKDAQSLFGADIPSDGIKVFKFFKFLILKI